MCQVNVDELFQHFSVEIRVALEQALRVSAPEVATQVDPTRFFSAFQSAIHRQCDQWEPVPDELVRA